MLQVTGANEQALQVRALVSAADASKAWDLRCRVRETLIDFLQRENPEALPRVRAQLEQFQQAEALEEPAPPSPSARTSTANKEPTHAGVATMQGSRAPSTLQDGVTGKGG